MIRPLVCSTDRAGVVLPTRLRVCRLLPGAPAEARKYPGYQERGVSCRQLRTTGRPRRRTPTSMEDADLAAATPGVQFFRDRCPGAEVPRGTSLRQTGSPDEQHEILWPPFRAIAGNGTGLGGGGGEYRPTEGAESNQRKNFAATAGFHPPKTPGLWGQLNPLLFFLFWDPQPVDLQHLFTTVGFRHELRAPVRMTSSSLQGRPPGLHNLGILGIFLLVDPRGLPPRARGCLRPPAIIRRSRPGTRPDQALGPGGAAVAWSPLGCPTLVLTEHRVPFFGYGPQARRGCAQPIPRLFFPISAGTGELKIKPRSYFVNGSLPVPQIFMGDENFRSGGTTWAFPRAPPGLQPCWPPDFEGGRRGSSHSPTPIGVIETGGDLGCPVLAAAKMGVPALRAFPPADEERRPASPRPPLRTGRLVVHRQVFAGFQQTPYPTDAVIPSGLIVSRGAGRPCVDVRVGNTPTARGEGRQNRSSGFERPFWANATERGVSNFESDNFAFGWNRRPLPWPLKRALLPPLARK